MNARRVAELHREMARLHAELAEAIAEAEPRAEVVQIRPAPTPRRPRTIVRPPGESDADAAARADRILRDRGFR